MKAILVNPEDATIKEVEVNDYHDIHKLLECTIFTCVGEDEDLNTIYADDEALYKDELYFSFIPDFYYAPIAGKCLFLGTDHEGESKDCTLTLEEVDRMVYFVNPKPIEKTPEKI